MAYTITAANIKPSTNASLEAVTGGEAISAGNAVYRDATLGKWYKSDANTTTPVSGGGTSPQTVEGIAVAACAGDGCSLVVCRSDSALDIGATSTDVMAAGEVGVLSATAGAIQPNPASSGSKTVVVWIANSATQVNLVFKSGGTVA